jgi:hypothetical protein
MMMRKEKAREVEVKEKAEIKAEESSKKDKEHGEYTQRERIEHRNGGQRDHYVVGY